MAGIDFRTGRRNVADDRRYSRYVPGVTVPGNAASQQGASQYQSERPSGFITLKPKPNTSAIYGEKQQQRPIQQDWETVDILNDKVGVSMEKSLATLDRAANNSVSRQISANRQKTDAQYQLETRINDANNTTTLWRGDQDISMQYLRNAATASQNASDQAVADRNAKAQENVARETAAAENVRSLTNLYSNLYGNAIGRTNPAYSYWNGQY